MDRSSDFFGTVEALRAHGGAAPSGLAQLAGAARLQPPSPLHVASRSIGRALRLAGRRVLRLYRLTHRRGLFDDPAAEINDLTLVIKAEVEALERQMGALGEAVVREHGALPGGDAPLPTGPAAHWAVAVQALRGHLQGVISTFQEALSLRAETMREASSRRHAFAPAVGWTPSRAGMPMDSPLFAAPREAGAGAGAAPPSPAPPVGGGAGGLDAGPALRRRAAIPSQRSSGAVQPYSAYGGAQGGPPPPLSYHVPPSLLAMHDARAKASEWQAVEATIVELGPMFTRMAGLVAEQGDVLDRIDTDVEAAGADVEGGTAELAKYLRSVQANRGFILKLFGVLALVVVLFGVFRR